MITLLLQTTRHEPRHAVVELWTSVDGWSERPVPGTYDIAVGAWKFELQFGRYSQGFSCKFVIQPNIPQAFDDLNFILSGDTSPSTFLLIDGQRYRFLANTMAFPESAPTRPVVENGRVQRRLFEKDVDPEIEFDVIVIGSGMAGGTLADHLSDDGLNVLVLEAGGFLFPTHTGNLPRQQMPGLFTKHIWELWDEFKIINYDNLPGSDFVGAQGFNLGGRSLFWGGFIPRMTSWELALWPKKVKHQLEDVGYLLAEDFMGRSTGPRTIYNREIHLLLRDVFPEMNHFDAPVAIRQRLEGSNSLATGVFSTADVLIESLLTNSRSGSKHLQLLLNHEVVEVKPDSPAIVVAHDLRRGVKVNFKAKRVVLCAGCFESARLVKRSAELPDPQGLVGKGTSDHPIFFTHFSIPRQSPYFDPFGNVKVLSQVKESFEPAVSAPFNMLLELGADLNHGRYIDENVWKDHIENRKDRMLCEIVFLCNDFLDSDNSLTFAPGTDARPQVRIKQFSRPKLYQQTEALKWKLLKYLRAQPTTGALVDIDADEEGWKRAFRERDCSGIALPGNVAHEAGSLRMRVTDKDGNIVSAGLVDEDCRYLEVANRNIYVCDLSIFPTTPAANPSLTLVALAIRLAEHLGRELKP